jgi:nicotinamide phosphoribosyltransferase
MVNQFSKEGSIYAVVSDSYDIYNAVDHIWGVQLAGLIREKKGTLVIRPDSGDPLEVIPRLLNSLSKNFGAVKNDKGYLVLNNVRLIWGDGINEMSIRSILRVVVDMMGYSADNIAFGMGGALLQVVNRDDLKFAMKCSAIRRRKFTREGEFDEWVDVFKDPITDKGKTSLKGRFAVVRGANGEWSNVPLGDATLVDNNELKIRFRDGQLLNMQTFAQVRANEEKS